MVIFNPIRPGGRGGGGQKHGGARRPPSMLHEEVFFLIFNSFVTFHHFFYKLGDLIWDFVQNNLTGMVMPNIKFVISFSKIKF